MSDIKQDPAVKARLMDQVLELILSDRHLSDEERERLCKWLAADEFAQWRDEALYRYFSSAAGKGRDAVQVISQHFLYCII